MPLNHVNVALVLALGNAVLLPRVPLLANHALTVTLGIAITIAVLAAGRRAWVDAGMGTAVAAILGFARVRWPDTDGLLLVLITTAILAFVFLNLTLLIGPWSRFFRPRFVRLMKHRRHVGVVSLLLALTHVNIVLSSYYNNQVPLALMIGSNVFGAASIYIIELLGLTSWDWAQGKITLRWWGVIHILTLLPYLGLLGLGWRGGGLTPLEKIILVGIAVWWLWLAPWRVQHFAHRTPNGWRQLHLLVYAAYLSVVVHIWRGVVGNRPLSTQVVFWLPVVFVVGSHAIGLFLKYRQQAVRRAAASAVPPPTVTAVRPPQTPS
ncbi:MAG: ferric reductase-like transmembrane domain-containing protein [bacterium]|nr:ferric reductase-like transmembrane domain-containing protein [bacterium]